MACRNSPNPLFKNHSTLLFTFQSIPLHLSKLFTGLFSETLRLGIFAKHWVIFNSYKKKRAAAVENVEKCSQINNNSDQKNMNCWHFWRKQTSKMFLGEITRNRIFIKALVQGKTITEKRLAVQWKILDPFVRNLWKQSYIKPLDN